MAAVDGGLIYGAFALAYYVRYVLKIGPAISDQISFSRYQPVALLLVPLILFVLTARGAYRSRMSTEIVDEIAHIFSAATITTAIIIVLETMTRNFQYSRGVIVYLWLLVIVSLSLGRGIFRSLQSYCHRSGWGVRRLLVVGASNIGKMVMQSVMSRPGLGYQLVGFVEHRQAANLKDFGRFRALGTMADLAPLLEAHAVDEIILAVPASAHEEALTVLQLCEKHGVGLKVVPDLFEMSLSRVQVDDIAGIPLLDLREEPLRPIGLAVKRVVDVIGAGVFLVVLSPLLLALSALIRLETTGAILLRQERVGLGGRRFTCLKFRTMLPGAEQLQTTLEGENDADGPLFKMRDDPRCTRLGRRIRRWSLDELPQLWNVLRGDMSLVGPRPALPEEVESYEPAQRRRLEVKPGMTGIWQVSGRSDLGFDEMVLMDITYVDNWSARLDVRILVRTILAVLARHGAY